MIYQMCCFKKVNKKKSTFESQMLLRHGQIFWVLIFLWLKLVKFIAGSHFKAFSGKAVTRVWF